MSYPTVTRKTAQQLVNTLRSLPPSEQLTSELNEQPWVADAPGGEYDRTSVERAAQQMKNDLYPAPDSNANLTELEGRMASRVHATLSELPVRVLQDPDFWRYLALFPFRWYLVAREPELKPQDFGGEPSSTDENGLVKFKGTDMKYQLLLRTYLWGKCALDENDRGGMPGNPYRRATATFGVKGLSTIDVWHSHMVRVQLGQLGEFPHSFIDTIVGEPPMSTNDARELEKLLARMKHTVLFDAYDYGSSAAVVKELAPKAQALALANR